MSLSPDPLAGPRADARPAARRPQGPFALGLTVVGLGLALFLLWGLRGEAAYWLSAPDPVDLGRPGAYALDRAADGALARIAGTPGATATRFERFGSRFEIVAVQGTHVLVRREARGPDLPRRPGAPEPPPDPAPFVAEGRLVRDTAIAEYGEAFRVLVERGEAEPRAGHLFVLLDGERPRTGLRTPAMLAGLTLLAGLNLWSLARHLRRRLAGR